MKISTIGFTKKSAQRFFTLLEESNTKTLIDVRLNNVSQLSGFAKRDDLKFFLKKICGIEYIHITDLAPQKEALKAYQDKKMSWESYESEFINLMEKRNIEHTLEKSVIEHSCLLCSEDKPHHCHRRLVAEYLKRKWNDEKVEIIHLK
ncbi:DUF488 domain-containing protein [Stenotrophomonas maltophilia]|uniref:DUF488 domain-containing protein n=1 Tax=Stenotrophomonas maltophilia group TaxID=995085 RepID=UPI0015DD7AAA|nr:DUF488 domain-containing protein [Stenotrophomonas maltophilia]MBA0433286.1 DUF488 domain-containing protein [Stenotrophomonas maltophilia]MDZ5813702.1 DUF488 domain-containing protein [Stenotrophomonas maltophilia]